MHPAMAHKKLGYSSDQLVLGRREIHAKVRGGNLKKIGHLKVLGMDWIFWLRIGTGGRLLSAGWYSLLFRTVREIHD